MSSSKEQRVLVVMRHGKAEQYARTDHERRLTDRGAADAADAGRWLREHEWIPDLALVSSAQRTQDTWRAVCRGLDCTPELVTDDSIYSGSPDTVLDILRALPARAGSALLVGHNPTVASLAMGLEDGDGDPEVFGRMSDGFPTSATAVLTWSGEWTDLAEGAARLVAFHVGRG